MRSLLKNSWILPVLFIMPICFAKDQIKFGFVAFNPPYVFTSQSGYIGGMDVEIAEAICTQLNVKCKFVQRPISQLYSMLNKNQVDAVMGAVAITPDKKSLFTFSKPYSKITYSLVTVTQSNLRPTLPDLKNRRLGVVKDTINYTYAYTHFPGTRISTYITAERLISALINKKVDVILMDTPAADYWVTYDKGQLKKLGANLTPSSDKGLGIVVKKGNTQLVNKINQAIDKIIDNRRLYNINQQYLKNK